MVNRKARDVEASLIRKGFRQEPRKHKFFVLYVDDKRTSINTHTSHCGQEIDEYLIKCMRKQLYLSKDDFLRLIDCPMSKAEYVEKLRENDKIT